MKATKRTTMRMTPETEAVIGKWASVDNGKPSVYGLPDMLGIGLLLFDRLTSEQKQEAVMVIQGRKAYGDSFLSSD